MLGFNIDDKRIYNVKTTEFNNFHLYRMRAEQEKLRKMTDKLNSIYYPDVSKFLI